MSIKQIIQESLDENPIGLKEALHAELKQRIGEILFSEDTDSDDEDEEEDDEDDSDADGDC